MASQMIAATKQTQVAERMVTLGEFCNELGEEISRLEKRLESILCQQEPNKSACEEKTQCLLVDLALRLDERATNIRHMIGRIQDICERLEL